MGNYPYKIIRTGDQVETVFNNIYPVEYVICDGKMLFEATVEKIDAVVVNKEGCKHTIQRELFRTFHTTEAKPKCKTKKN